MNYKKYVSCFLIGIGIFIGFYGQANANFIEEAAGAILRTLQLGFYSAITSFLAFVFSFIAGALTFGILLLSNMLDLIFIKVPYLGDILGTAGDVAFINTVRNVSIVVTIFSLLTWLLLGGSRYIKDSFEEFVTMGANGSKFSYIRDFISKFFVIILIFTIPFSFPYIAKGVNGMSGGLLQFISAGYDGSDRIVIASKPLTTLIEQGLSIPTIEGVSGNEDKRVIEDEKSIYNEREGDFIEDNQLLPKAILNSIIDKAWFQFGRFNNLNDTIALDASIESLADIADENNVEISETSGSEKLSALGQGSQKGAIIFFFFSIIYIMLLYTILMKVFKIFMILITRFVSVILGSIWLPFNLALLGSEDTRKLGKRNILSFCGDILVTPMIAGYIGITILVLSFFSSAFAGENGSLLYFGVGDGNVGYQASIFASMIIMAMLYGMLNKLEKLIEYFGANFENIFSENGGQGIQDSYGSPGEAIDVASKTFGMSKSVGSYLGAGKALGALKGGAAGFGTYVGAKSIGQTEVGRSILKNESFKDKTSSYIKGLKSEGTSNGGNNTDIQKD